MNSPNSLLQKTSWTQPSAPVLTNIHYRTPPKFKHPNQRPFIRDGSTISMQRILIIGSSGSGKSTLARQLGAMLELPVIHLDRHYWNPGWVGTPPVEWHQTVDRLLQRKSWIMDGNYRGTLEARLEAADSVVFLDLPPWICAYRAVKRRIQYRNRPRPDIADGCKERLLDPKLVQFVQHVMRYPERAKPYVMNQLLKIANVKHVVHLQSPQDVNNFLSAPLDYPSLRLIRQSYTTNRPQIARLPLE